MKQKFFIAWYILDGNDVWFTFWTVENNRVISLRLLTFLILITTYVGIDVVLNSFCVV